MNINDTDHICVGTRHNETHKKLLNKTGFGGAGNGLGSAVERGYIDLSTAHI
jgi:hypothetical protein